LLHITVLIPPLDLMNRALNHWSHDCHHATARSPGSLRKEAKALSSHPALSFAVKPPRMAGKTNYAPVITTDDRQ